MFACVFAFHHTNATKVVFLAAMSKMSSFSGLQMDLAKIYSRHFHLQVGSLRELIFVCSGIRFRSIDIKIPTHHSRCKNSSKPPREAYQSKLVPRSHGFLFVHFDNLIVATWRLSISFSWVGWHLEVGWYGIVLEIWMILNGNGNVAGLLQSSLVFLGRCSSIAFHIWFRHNWWREGSISQVHSNPQRSTQVNWCLNKSVRNTMGRLGCAFVESKLHKLKYQLQTTPFFPNFCLNKSWWCPATWSQNLPSG